MVLFWKLLWLVPIAVVLSVWGVVAVHYYIETPEVPGPAITGGRENPSEDLLGELGSFYYHRGLQFQLNTDGDVLHVAEEILRGRINVLGYEPHLIHMPFAAEDLEQGSGMWQLEFASLIVARVLLQAHASTHREEFLLAARDHIIGMAAFERQAWIPKGFIWNDHAIAARTLVLGEFWRQYRHHRSYEENIARELFEFAARHIRFLSDPGHYTFSTNHGVMQNLGLLHLSLTFPTLPDSSTSARLAVDRLRQQMSYYVSKEGVILEHSAGYQEFGINLLSMAARYLTLLGVQVDASWKLKYEKAMEYYALLLRPDRSVPIFGDTYISPNHQGPLIVNCDEHCGSSPVHHVQHWRPSRANSLFPLSGYFVRWDGLERWPSTDQLQQTVVNWSYFNGHGHKHADEMSVHVWARGINWITNQGYWAGADQWSGSNAPHLSSEHKKSQRRAYLRYYGWSPNLSLIDTERVGPKTLSARRQVLHVSPDLWVILDRSIGVEGESVVTVWHSSTDIEWHQTADDTYLLRGTHQNQTMTASFIGVPGFRVRPSLAAELPEMQLAMQEDPKERATVGVVVEQPPHDGWTASVWRLNNLNQQDSSHVNAPTISMVRDDHWTMNIPLASRTLQIERDGSRLILAHPGEEGIQEALTLLEAKSDMESYDEVRQAFEESAKKYPRFRDEPAYRTRMTGILLVILMIQEMAFLLLARTFFSRWAFTFRLIGPLAWIVGGFWLHTVYFVKM